MKMFGDPVRTLLLIAFCLVCHSTGAMAQQTAGQRFEKALYLEEVNGKLQQAIDQYQLILKEFPANREIIAKSQLHMGICYEKLGLNQARENYQAVINKYPDQKGEVAIANERLKRLDQFASESSLKAEQTFKLAGDLFKQFNYIAAEAVYEKVIQLVPNSRLAEEARLWIGQCYFKQGKYDQALVAFKSLIKEFPESTIVPVTELMISQVNQALQQLPKKSNVITLDDKTILDPATGIRYTRIKTWAGKYDIIKSAASITDIAPNRQYLLADNMVIPFENGVPYILPDTTVRSWSYRLSPSADKIAFFTTSSLSVIPVSPETGRPTGPIKQLISKPILSIQNTLNWSPDGVNLVFSEFKNMHQFNLLTYSTKNDSLKQVTNLPGRVYNPIFLKNGLDIIYKYIPDTAGNYSIRKSPLTMGTSATIVDKCWYNDGFILSPDNRWIFFSETSNIKNLFRLADQQKRELSVPEEVGEFVSWADEGSKVFFYRTSYQTQDVIKVSSIYGGPGFECGRQSGQFPVSWTPDSKGLFIKETSGGNNYYNQYNTAGIQRSLTLISLTNQDSKTIEGIENTGTFPSFSPDCSKILLGVDFAGKPTDLSILDFSLTDFKIKGKPILIFKGFNGYTVDYSWSPDGKKIVLCKGGDVWICSTDGGAPVQLTRTAEKEFFPKWSPDGTAIAVFIRSTSQLRIIRATDGSIIGSVENADLYDWLPNGKEIIIAFKDGQLSSFSPISGKIHHIVNWQDFSHGSIALKCSPDGNWFAMSGFDTEEYQYENNIYLINASNGKSTKIASDISGNKQFMIWSPNSKWIAYCQYITPFSISAKKTGLEGTLWEADLTDFMKKIAPGN